MLQIRLHAKFLLLILGSLSIFLGVLSYALVQRDSNIIAQKVDEEQHVLAFAVLSDLKQSMLQGTPRNTLELMDSIRGAYGLVRLQVVRSDGSPAFGIAGGRLSLPQVDRAIKTGSEVSFQEDGPVPLCTILYPLKNEKECLACHGRQKDILGVLLVSLSREGAVKEIRESKRNLSLSLAALILAIGSMLYFAIRKVILSPLAVLHEGAERIGKGELEHRISLSTNDEFQDLARSFNAMAGRIEESYSGLEIQVKERTAQLSDAMEEVEDKARRLYEFSRDMASVSRLSTKVFNAGQSLEQILDRFMWAVDRGLRYKQSLLCLVDRKRVRLDVKRDSGLGAQLGIAGRSLSGDDPFTALVRTGNEVYIHDGNQDPVFGRTRQVVASGPRGLYVIPILNGTRNKMCWREKKCIRTDCPAYKREDEPCWLVENTYCGNELIESYHNKLAYCATCDVFPVLGVLVVGARPGRPFKRRDVSVLRILAAEMGAALENHRLYGDNRRVVAELLELHKVTALALTELSLDRTLDAFTDSALKFSGLDTCNFWLLTEDGRGLSLKASGSTGPEPEAEFCRERIPLDAGVLGRAFRQNAVITDYHVMFSDKTPLGKATAARGLPSLLAVPLKTEGPPLGVFSVHKKSEAPFLETEIAAFMLFANHAAMAINVCLLNEELKHQNRELERNINLREGILASMSSGVMLLDMTGTVELINQAGAEILHLRPAEMVNRRLTDLAPQAEAFLNISAGPYREVEIERQDGTNVPVGFSSAHCRAVPGAQEGIIVVYRDLTEIKVLQAEVLKKERFAAMGRVVAGVAHEIRNPLFGISSIGQIFERELADPAHRELSRALLSETRRLNQLVEELLVYGRPMKLRPAWCDLFDLWEEVIGIHRDEIGKKGVKIGGGLDIVHTRAYLDANQIRQVFLNLLRNAIEATPAGGEIAIRLLLEDRFIIFKVTDTGCGIPAENVEKVFDLFFTTKPRGTGLGLGICKKIVEDHGGLISIESRQWDYLDERKGTTVTVKLPYRRVPDSADVQATKNG